MKTAMDFANRRARMVDEQLVARGIDHPGVLEAMRRVPREMFLPEPLREAAAYRDSPLPIAEGQTISQPFIVARMAEAADLGPAERVLEIGTGSGYAAAVMSVVCGQLFSIERHPALAEAARLALTEGGFSNVQVRVGDGTLGWPEQAPFDAIVATAGGREVPASWKEQLAIGGRLVMPVGEQPRRQRLIKITRHGEREFEEEHLGAVLFVPLIGAQGWSEDEARRGRANPRAVTQHGDDEAIAVALLSDAAEPLPEPRQPAFAEAFDRFAGHRLVLLGEASHGTREFYLARAAITRRLVERHGFTAVAVEADWPDADVIDRYVRDRPRPRHPDPPFQRFPTWMWRNREMQAFTRWLHRHNRARPAAERVGFHGLDLYNLAGSIAVVLDYLDEVDPEAAALARSRYGCLSPWQDDPAGYGRQALMERYRGCEGAVVAQLRDLLAKRLDYAADDGDRFFSAAQSARLVTAAERYYRALYQGGAASWNLRDRHMFDTLRQVLDEHGPDAKIVVWAHNSHIGDARATDMGDSREQLNLGQLCREAWGADVALIGFGTDHGTVRAARDWGGPGEIMNVPPARDDSYEALAHRTGIERFLVDLREGVHEDLRARLMATRLERFIGVIYRPDTELRSHYARATLPAQFDGYVWFDESEALAPLTTDSGVGGEADTWPFGR